MKRGELEARTKRLETTQARPRTSRSYKSTPAAPPKRRKSRNANISNAAVCIHKSPRRRRRRRRSRRRCGVIVVVGIVVVVVVGGVGVGVGDLLSRPRSYGGEIRV